MEKHTVLIVGGTTGYTYDTPEIGAEVGFWYYTENGWKIHSIGIVEDVLE